MKNWWKTHKLFRDCTLAALAVLVGGLAAYLNRFPEYALLYLTLRAAIGQWIKSQGGPDIP
jgi:hypothetical protein